MEYKDIVAIAGKPGLYRIVKPTRVSVIVESLDSKKSKLVASANQKISVLDEISIYTTDQEGSMPLPEILQQIYQLYQEDTGLDKDSDNTELQAFFQSVVPEYDHQKVYPSDIKKVIKWYEILLKEAPELLNYSTQEEE